MRLGFVPTKKSDGFLHYLTKGAPWCFMVLSLGHASILAYEGPSWLQYTLLGLLIANFITIAILVRSV